MTITTAQAKALMVLAAKGALYAGNEHGITSATIAALEAKGLVTVRWSVVQSVAPGGRVHYTRDWSAK